MKMAGLKGAKTSELCRGLILESGCTVAMFSCCRVVVLEPNGSCFSVISEGRYGGNPSCESHPVRFTPSKHRAIVSLALQFRNLYTENPFIPTWMIDMPHDSTHLSIPNQKNANLKCSPVQSVAKSKNNFAQKVVHWPMEMDGRYVKKTVDGTVDILSIENDAKLSLCHLGKRLSVSFSVLPTNYDSAAAGRERGEHEDSNSKYSNVSDKGHVSMITQFYSLRQIPSCFEIPARMALMTYHTHSVEDNHTKHGKGHKRSAHTPVIKPGLKISDSNRNVNNNHVSLSSKRDDQAASLTPCDDDGSATVMRNEPLPKYSPPFVLPSSPNPTIPTWNSIDSSDGLHLHQNNEYSRGRKYFADKNDIQNFSNFDTHDSCASRLTHKLLPSELLGLAKRANLAHKEAYYFHNENDEDEETLKLHENSMVLMKDGESVVEPTPPVAITIEKDEDEAIHHMEETYPISKHCSLVEWSPRATFRAFPLLSPQDDLDTTISNDNNQVDNITSTIKTHKTKCIVEVTIHEDDSFLVIDGDYATHFTRKKINTIQDKSLTSKDDCSLSYSTSSRSSNTGICRNSSESPDLDKTAPLSQVLPAEKPLDCIEQVQSEVCERCYHITVVDYITIEDDSRQQIKYRLGPFVRKAQALSAQVSLVYNSSSDNEACISSPSSLYQEQSLSKATRFIHPVRTVNPLPSPPTHPLLYHDPTTPHQDDLLNQQVCATKKSAVMTAPPYGVDAGIVFKNHLPHVTLSAYLDGSCRGHFTDRTMVSLRWVVDTCTNTPSSKLHGNINKQCVVESVINVITPTGSECVVDYCDDDTIVQSRRRTTTSKLIIDSVIPHIKLVVKFARWATASEEERNLMNMQTQQQQLAIAREMKKNALFVGREQLEEKQHHKRIDLACGQ